MLNLVDGTLRICTSSAQVFWGSAKMRINNPKEYALLRLLMDHAGQVMSRKKILEQLYDWKEPYTDDAGRIIDVIVNRYSRKFEAFTGSPLPISRRNNGYVYEKSRLPRIDSTESLTD